MNIRELDYLPPNTFGIYKYHQDDLYILWPHNLTILYNSYKLNKSGAVAYVPFIYRNKQVILKK